MLWWFLCGFAHAAGVRVVGSDLLGVEFSKSLYAFAVGADLPLALALDGSRPGLAELQAGRATLGLLVLAPGEEAPAAEFERRVVAYHRVVLLAPAGVPLDRVTLEQAEGVFADGAPQPVSSWGELGFGGAWAVSAIKPYAPAAGAGLAAEYFRSRVLRGRPFKPHVARYAQVADLAIVFGGDSRAFAIAAGPPPAGVAATPLAVAARRGQPAYLPTLENVHSGDYSLRLPLAAVYRREALDSLRPLLRFLCGDECAPHWERAGLAPLPSAARRQQLASLDRP